MTLDEAIKHAEEVAEDKETRAKECIVKANSNNEWLFDYEVRKLIEESVSCAECAAEHRQLVKWLKELKQLMAQTRWIPVSEKLPEDGIYLVTVERTACVPRIDIMSFAKDLNRIDDFDFPEHKCGWYDYDSEYGYWEDTNVIAWKPLPQPYKGESEE